MALAAVRAAAEKSTLSKQSEGPPGFIVSSPVVALYIHTISHTFKDKRQILYGLDPYTGDRPGPVYEGIVEALGADVASGRLHRGERLPTHRALAQALGVDLTTVTRAYNEARRRGLTEARVGQGTFVAESAVPRAARARRPGIEFDLSMNLPPEPIEADLEGRLARGLDGAAARLRLHRFPELPAGRRQRGRSRRRGRLAAQARAHRRGRSPADLPRHADRADEPAAGACEAGRRAADRSADLSRASSRPRRRPACGWSASTDERRHDPGGAGGSLQAAQAQGGLSHPDHPQSDDAHDPAGAARRARGGDPQARPAAVRGRCLWQPRSQGRRRSPR